MAFLASGRATESARLDEPARWFRTDRRGSDPCQSAQIRRFRARISRLRVRTSRALTPLSGARPQSVIANNGRLRECPPPFARGALSRTQGPVHDPAVVLP